MVRAVTLRGDTARRGSGKGHGAEQLDAGFRMRGGISAPLCAVGTGGPGSNTFVFHRSAKAFPLLNLGVVIKEPQQLPQPKQSQGQKIWAVHAVTPREFPALRATG
jgi:hypothetical protein